jgi:hypothetical protein
MTLMRLRAALICLLVAGACSDQRLDRTFKALEGASEAQLIVGMGRPPDNVVPLQSGAKILQWRRSENVYQSGTPGQVMVVANTAYYLPGARPKVEHEFCLINWTVTDGIATQYHWQGDCRSLQNRPGG